MLTALTECGGPTNRPKAHDYQTTYNYSIHRSPLSTRDNTHTQATAATFTFTRVIDSSCSFSKAQSHRHTIKITINTEMISYERDTVLTGVCKF